jgi:N-acyl-D-aspartate/D-glutamate deacylase
MAQYDLKITGGTIVDGSGKPGYTGDVGIANGRIVALGEAPGEARDTFDARGKVVAPGFVDVHTHYDAQVFWDRNMSISPWHGVTTVVMGNCGFGVAPTRPEDRRRILQTLEKVEGMSIDALEAGLSATWPFESFPQYLDAIEKSGSAINTAALLGHTPLRMYVMGGESTEREARPEEIEAMVKLTREAIDAGAIGFSTSASKVHVGYEGRPVPSRLASFEEIRRLTKVMGEAGKGILQANVGPTLFYDEMAELQRDSGRPITWTALLGGFWGPGQTQKYLDRALAQQDEGLNIVPQVACRPINFEFTFAEPFPFENLKLFKPIAAAGPEEKKRIFADPSFRAAFKDEFGPHTVRVMTAWWDKTTIAFHPTDHSLDERVLGDVARERGIDPVDLALDMALATDLQVRFRLAILNADEKEVGHLLQSRGTLVALSDAGAHASQLCDACYSTHLLGHWVRDKGIFSLEDAVKKLTSDPADLFGIAGRGRLAKGNHADVVVFDAGTIGAGRLRRVNDQPAGQDRLVADAIGVELVVVNGTPVRRHGKDLLSPNGAMPGRLLRNGVAA